MNTEDQKLKEILAQTKTIAVVGLSPEPDRPSHEVAAYMQKQGYKIVPVRPGVDKILGEKAYASLKDIPFEIDLVDIFRKPDAISAIVDEAIEKKAKAVWMQLGLEHNEAAQKAVTHGLKVVQDRCLAVEHKRLK